jgi:hypothetical protein
VVAEVAEGPAIAGGYLVLVRGKSDTYQFRVSLGEEIR